MVARVPFSGGGYHNDTPGGVGADDLTHAKKALRVRKRRSTEFGDCQHNFTSKSIAVRRGGIRPNPSYARGRGFDAASDDF